MRKRFCDLEIWQIGYDLLMEVYELTKSFPRFEQYALVSQIIRSANSVIANIAESHGRYYYLDKVRVLYIARAEIQETQSHLKVALGQGYFSEDSCKKLDEKYEELTKQVNAYISYLSKQS